jgi:vacuolar-type H+-ATPase subunit I/STV1
LESGIANQDEFESIHSQINEQRASLLDAAIDKASSECSSAISEMEDAQTEIKAAIDDVKKMSELNFKLIFIYNPKELTLNIKCCNPEN